MVEPYPLHHRLLLFPVGLSSLPLLFHLFFDDFFEALVGLLFLLITLFDVVAQLLELVEVLHEVQFLDGKRGTSRAASRCSALMVFFWAYSHLVLARSDTRHTNSKSKAAHLWKARVVLPQNQGCSSSKFFA